MKMLEMRTREYTSGCFTDQAPAVHVVLWESRVIHWSHGQKHMWTCPSQSIQTLRRCYDEHVPVLNNNLGGFPGDFLNVKTVGWPKNYSKSVLLYGWFTLHKKNWRKKEKCSLDGERNGSHSLEKEGLKQHFPVIHSLNIP